ncbi:Chs5p-Arf1p-binding proteins-domain-containing protein [Dipodascopsis tothii]|uniref:Chs5p-Arf1p-binding proteins-domain-containing protein n=1 Tax=Dipodascopsis tothii TaxID=44089 RepID=UPI0034CDD833
MVASAVPEIQEIEIGESINTRTAALSSFHTLGPPDLVHLVKWHPKTNTKEAGTYHYVTGVDTSSASFAAYLTSLTYSLGENQMWFGKQQTWKIHSGTYCCYNAFSRVDLRVRVQIPGSVEAFAVDERGEKRGTTDELWLETYVCAVVRALLFAEDDDYSITAYRKFNPIATVEAEERFLSALEKLLTRGWQLGSDPEVQVPTLVSNNLTTALFKFLKLTGRYTEGLNLLEKLREKDADLAPLVARCLLEMDEEVKAVALLHSSIKEASRDPNLLELQTQFCLSKGRLDFALETAKRAVNSAPSEFAPWARLVKVYIELKDYQQALLTLNSCPMFPYQNIDLHRMPVAQRVHLPAPAEGVLPEVSDENSIIENEAVDPALLRLPAAPLRGTFAKAYALLVEIVHNIGWDALLKYRTRVFIMEEEYRSLKSEGGHARADSNASNVAINSKPSMDSPSENGLEAAAGIQAPEQSVDADVVKGQEEPHAEGSENGVAATSTFRSKRLCERWLDNLFMVMYEDMRVYTLWRAEFAHYKSQQLVYRKTGREWEILGNLALRLRHEDKALEAYSYCLGAKFSQKALYGLLKIYVERNEPSNILNAVVKLTSYNHRWYTEFSPSLISAITKLMADEGLEKVRNKIQGSDFPPHVIALMMDYFSFGEEFHVPGFE